MAQPREKNLAPAIQDFNYKASPWPDRIILTWSENDPSTQTVTWRTDTTVHDIEAEIAKVTPYYEFYKDEEDYDARSVTVKTIDETVQYHTATFEDLEPDTWYAYRVKADDYSSEWVQFITPPEEEDESWRFIYLGDAQNDLLRLWSRMVRQAYRAAPDARFMLHAGDLINHAQNNYEWGEWFQAASFIFRMIPQIVVPGNHEYIKNATGHKTGISPLYDPQFNFPDNGMDDLGDINYFIDYLNCKIICLNSNEMIEEQAVWLDEVLSRNHKKWVIVTFHHPVMSAAKDRQNEEVMLQWKPILDKYRVDLVLQGHDHTYGRGNQLNTGLDQWNEESGTVYVVSVSGRKMYESGDLDWMQKKAENQQFYQIISIEDTRLIYKAFTSDDRLFDGFTLDKRNNRKNKFTEISEGDEDIRREQD